MPPSGLSAFIIVSRCRPDGQLLQPSARDQRKPKIALPVRTRRHWILLNNTRRANYTANFSKCLRPLSGVREPRARSSATEKQKFAVRDSTLVAWYRSVYAPRAGGAYDSHPRTAGIAGCTRRRGGGKAAGGARAASGETWWSREKLRRNHVNDRGDKCQMRHT